jgi:hypothetical protein
VTDDAGNHDEDTWEIFVRGPDFKVDAIIFSDRNPMHGDKVRISAMLNNTGQLEWANVTVLLSVDGRKVEEKVVDSLPVNTETIVNFTWTAQKGRHTIKLTVDPRNETAEWNYTNNFMERVINVEAKPLRNIIIIAVIIILVVGIFIFIRRRRRGFEKYRKREKRERPKRKEKKERLEAKRARREKKEKEKKGKGKGKRK